MDVTVKPAAHQLVSCHWRCFTAELFSLINIPVKVQLLYHLWDSLAHRVHTLFCNSAGGGQHCTPNREMSRSWATLVSLMHLSSLITGICMTHIVIGWGVRIVTCCPHVLPWLQALHHIHTCFCDLSCVPYTFTNWQWILTVQNLSHAQIETHCVLPTLHTVSSSPDIFKLTAWWCNTYSILSWLYDQHWTVTRGHSQQDNGISHRCCCYLIFQEQLYVLVKGYK